MRGRSAFHDTQTGFGPTRITASVMAQPPAARSAPAPPPPPPTTSTDSVVKALSPTELDRLLSSIQNPAAVPATSSLPPEASIVPVAEAHIPSLRRINALLLPVDYTGSFYKNILEPLTSGLFSRAVLWADPARPAAQDKVVGGMVCRFETNPFVDEVGRPRLPEEIRRLPYPSWQSPYHAIYIQSLGILSPYRSQGLAAAALEHIIASAVALRDHGPRYEDDSALPMINVQVVYAHVWTENEEGLRWYESRGFVRDLEPLQGYYYKLQPGSAWIVRKEIGPASLGAI
ncbi:hypothetical protein GQ53DRAFT_337396 [Thozetella sp. PMI_491]|nr:hypothetical protein GQ53DRAFT_337396 [Thozetella sp. PMI_491]